MKEELVSKIGASPTPCGYGWLMYTNTTLFTSHLILLRGMFVIQSINPISCKYRQINSFKIYRTHPTFIFRINICDYITKYTDSPEVQFVWETKIHEEPKADRVKLTKNNFISTSWLHSRSGGLFQSYQLPFHRN